MCTELVNVHLPFQEVSKLLPAEAYISGWYAFQKYIQVNMKCELMLRCGSKQDNTQPRSSLHNFFLVQKKKTELEEILAG